MTVVTCEDAPLVLTLDVAGRPARWLPWHITVLLYCRERVAWEAGDTRIRIRGGRSRFTGEPTELLLSSIVAVRGFAPRHNGRLVPSLTNEALFRRDRRLCLYCGDRFPVSRLTRDHVVPRTLAGADRWENVATACLACNQRKGARTPHQAGMRLLAVPYAPNMAEWLILSNRRILADQMRFLESGTGSAHTSAR
jgi:5-methylcytosine-specific restriction endonuclease McrA